MFLNRHIMGKATGNGAFVGLSMADVRVAMLVPVTDVGQNRV
jgi:hypothetical protein